MTQIGGVQYWWCKLIQTPLSYLSGIRSPVKGHKMKDLKASFSLAQGQMTMIHAHGGRVNSYDRLQLQFNARSSVGRPPCHTFMCMPGSASQFHISAL